MPSLVVHLLIPLLVLLALRLAPPKVALLMLPFALFPDLDHWVGVPRATLHNLFIPLLATALWYRWRHTHVQRAKHAAVAAYYLASAVLMDMFAGGVVLLSPFLNRTFLVDCRVLVRTETHELIPICNPETEAGAPTIAEIYTWISPFEVAMVAWTLAVVLVVFAARWYRSRDEA